VTVIEAINTTGWILPPMVIFKGQLHQHSWYQALPLDWTIGVSENGWITDELGLSWLKRSLIQIHKVVQLEDIDF
jgi:hypothetical protein